MNRDAFAGIDTKWLFYGIQNKLKNSPDCFVLNTL